MSPTRKLHVAYCRRREGGINPEILVELFYVQLYRCSALEGEGDAT